MKVTPVAAVPTADSVVIQSVRPAVLQAVRDFATTLEKELDSDETIINALTARPGAPHTAHLQQLRANADLRARFLREVPLLQSVGVAKVSGSTARNDSAKQAQWKAERRVCSVVVDGVDRYPLFQFTSDGQPLPAMRKILEIFAELADWPIALWFFAPNAWLGNAPPMNVLPRDPESVIRAATHAVEPLEV